ncbi:FAD-dependent oxidoreductase [Amnibacterium setariae]|uniref:NAD(P)/FAD-dependent oxidoreductase n=1 Tax=Amnibacterium setariae TaxID=2306585 RepID=A0A3A1UA24_9MICO|nr:FAD-dependent oxidoreductase [Amnibacterium setariae]RIX30186.1 NAD(P)/FAD-dependent oxidoreductase [Amnibacterium setariae]
MVAVPARTDVVVIGAGQAGLSVAYYLQRLGVRSGVDQVVVDRGPGPGGAWQQRWAALRLGSAHRVHDLPGMRRAGITFETADRSRPARDVVGEYYGHYERFYGLDVRRPVTVAAVFDRGAELVVRTTVGEIVTRTVVNATGTWGAPFVPYYPGVREFSGRQVHTATYRDAADFAGLRVLVVGGGTSAIGFLLELEGVAAKTFWATRRPVDYLDQGTLDLEAAVTAVNQQDDAAKQGRALPSIVSGTGVPKTRRIAAAIERGVLSPRPMFDHLEREAVVWPDGSRERIDAIVWATGFRPDIRHLSPLRLHEKAGGVQVTSGAAERDPRIFFAGYGPTASTIGANRAGRTLARQVFAALGDTTTAPIDAVPGPTTQVLEVPPPEPEDHVAQLMARFFTDA